jgi:hypothetical protein
LVETIYGKEGWIEKKKAGYGLFVERAAALGGAGPSSLKEPTVAPELEIVLQSPSGLRLGVPKTSTFKAPPVAVDSEVYERENNRAIVLLFRVCSEVEVMSPVYDGIDDEFFLERIRGLYGHHFSEFQRSEKNIEAREDLTLDSTWGQRIESFGSRIRAEIARLRESEALTKYALVKGQACMIKLAAKPAGHRGSLLH